jgi:hypothetical protein
VIGGTRSHVHAAWAKLVVNLNESRIRELEDRVESRHWRVIGYPAD